MNVLTYIRRMQRSAPVLNVVLLACLGVLLAPCAMANGASAPLSEAVTAVGVHDECPNAKPSAAMTDSDCCCDLTAVTSGNALQLDDLVTLNALPVDLDIFNPILSIARVAPILRPRPHDKSPRIILTTQRLRI